MKNQMNLHSPLFLFMLLFGLFYGAQPAFAHHVLGRPAYSLNENSNTPPSAVVETQIGDYFVTYMVFPAFPQPNEAGRVNLYASQIETGEPFNGEVTFIVQTDRLLSSQGEILGIQSIDDGVYRQSFIFNEPGDYRITAEFSAQGQDYAIDFPLQIGDPAPIGPLGIIVIVLASALVCFNLWQRKRLLRAKVIDAHRKPQE
jgi:hypothetical protein